MSYAGQQNRVEWYDRNPLVVVGSSQLDTGPHAQTTRATYTVPAAKKCLIETLYNQVMRITGAAPVGKSAFISIIQPSGTIISQALQLNNNVGGQVQQSIAGALVLLTTQGFDLASYDLSTGGTSTFTGAFKGTEFDQ